MIKEVRFRTSGVNRMKIKQERALKEYDSLWEEKEEKGESPDPMEIADDTEINVELPDIGVEGE